MSDEPSSAELTLRALKSRWNDYDLDRGYDRFTNAVVRGATVGLAARGGLYLASTLLGSLKRKKSAKASRSPDGSLMITNTLRYGAFMASFAGVYVGADEVIAILFGKDRSKSWRSLVAGAVAGPTLSLVESRDANVGIAIYALMKGAVLMVRCGNIDPEKEAQEAGRGEVSRGRRALYLALAPTRWRHGDVLLMCLNSAQIFYSWIMLPQTLPVSYVRFLNKHGGQTPVEYRAMRELSGDPSAPLPRSLRALANTPGLSGVPVSRLGDFAFPGKSAVSYVVEFLPRGVLRAVPVYVPVYVVPALLVHRARLMRPKHLLTVSEKIAWGIARSSAFLGSYCTIAWMGVLGAEWAWGRSTGATLAAGSFVSGLALLLEKKSRRMEIAVYCSSRAFEAALLGLEVARVIPAGAMPGRPDIVVFSVAAAFIAHCYSDYCGRRREVFRRQWLSGFDWILGNEGFEAGSIRHSPSNLEYIRRIGSSRASLLVRSSSRKSFDVLRRAASRAQLSDDRDRVRDASGSRTPATSLSQPGSARTAGVASPTFATPSTAGPASGTASRAASGDLDAFETDGEALAR